MLFYLRGGLGPLRYSHRLGHQRHRDPRPQSSVGVWLVAIVAATIYVGFHAGWIVVPIGAVMMLVAIALKKM